MLPETKRAVEKTIFKIKLFYNRNMISVINTRLIFGYLVDNNKIKNIYSLNTTYNYSLKLPNTNALRCYEQLVSLPS